MALADTKKTQTIRNLWCTRVAEPIERANAVVTVIRAAIVGNNLQGQFTAGELAAMQAVETNLQALAVLPGVTEAAGKHRPHHATEQDTVGLEI